MNCSFAEDQILASFDAPLPERESHALREHLAGCEACAKFQRAQL
ncbi:MAG: zf-HC2 domain-containing protein, partial [bacterium]